MRINTHFHINGSALSLSLKQRLEVTRKWPFYWQITVIGFWQIQNKIDLSEVLWACETEQPSQTIVFAKTAGNKTSPHAHHLKQIGFTYANAKSCLSAFYWPWSNWRCKLTSNLKGRLMRLFLLLYVHW